VSEAVQTKNYDAELRLALRLAREAGAAILELYKRPIEVLQKFDLDMREPVTVADRVANDLIVSALQTHFPGDGILAEESLDTEDRLSKRRVWMVDPLDGTNGFIDGNGDFAVQIGLAEDGEAVLGVVYQPLVDLMYRAVRGGGAWIERLGEDLRRAEVSARRDVSQMRLAASRSHRSPRMDRVVRALDVKQEVQRGSVGIKVGLIIEQQCDLYLHLSPRTRQWDTCAPQIILREAGGLLSDLFGGPITYNSAEVQHRNGLLASNGVSHEHVIKTLRPVLAEFGRVPV
jgi:3'(2'), 5'-bisphosphate nucleotidase